MHDWDNIRCILTAIWSHESTFGTPPTVLLVKEWVNEHQCYPNQEDWKVLESNYVSIYSPDRKISPSVEVGLTFKGIELLDTLKMCQKRVFRRKKS